MSTIRDVAKLANVSVATVSRVINANGYVNENTKQKVEEAIKQLNYRPNDVARSLFNGKSKMIALFVPDIQNPFFPELARAVEDMANSREYTFILCNTDNNNQKEIDYLQALLQKSIDGFIFVSSTIKAEQIENINVPIVAMDRKISPELVSVTVDNRDGARQAVEYLQSIGCKRIGHICGPENVSSSRNRLQGYLDVVKKEDWLTSDFVQVGDHSIQGGLVAAMELLQKNPDIDGIFAANDLMAVGVLKAVEQLGIRVPEQLSVIGFDNTEPGKVTTPQLTTINQPIYDIGKRAAELLIQQIETPDSEIESVIYNVELIVRGSTKPLQS
ncbi:LacI family DNA-binding transcriptional regulator [Virgibacillus halodenitrificans]|uniref:LacI family DNA-binding transcriptional regulator n=1 Tax=Virgibacillus halodenitrificans TaxID=1482 RepID=UPI00045D2301|nr:LacI family DNA-binding transcriptional regulator [Virgibacillus halodenitrificans]CDQ31177.1 Glucose-resistance amylase regulator [Virgibacillus halodenitrificans]